MDAPRPPNEDRGASSTACRQPAALQVAQKDCTAFFPLRKTCMSKPYVARIAMQFLGVGQDMKPMSDLSQHARGRGATPMRVSQEIGKILDSLPAVLHLLILPGQPSLVPRFQVLPLQVQVLAGLRRLRMSGSQRLNFRKIGS